MNPRVWKRPKSRPLLRLPQQRPVTETAWLLRFALSFHDPGRVGSLVQNAAEQRPRCLVVAKHIELIRYHRLRRRRRNGDERAPTDTGEALGIADRAICNRITAVARKTDSDECGKRLPRVGNTEREPPAFHWRRRRSVTRAFDLGDLDVAGRRSGIDRAGQRSLHHPHDRQSLYEDREHHDAVGEGQQRVAGGAGR